MKAEVLRHEKLNPTGTLGDAIRAARLQAGLTREQLSEATGVPKHWLGRWERDRSIPSEDQWLKLSKILTIPLKSNFILAKG